MKTSDKVRAPFHHGINGDRAKLSRILPDALFNEESCGKRPSFRYGLDQR